jgi:hypothetical protein
MYSDLGGPYVYEGRAFEITLYRLPDSEWVIELSDEENLSVVLEESYPSEESAYAAALETIREGVMETSMSTTLGIRLRGVRAV